MRRAERECLIHHAGTLPHARHGDDAHTRRQAAKSPDQLQAVHHGHEHVDKNDVGTPFGEHTETLGAIRRALNFVARAPQDLQEDLANARVVVHYQDPHHGL